MGASRFVRAYETALMLMPPAFRHEFGPEMTCDLADLIAEERVRGGSAWRRFAWAVADLLRVAPGLWIRSGLPFVALAAAATAFTVVAVIAQIVPRTLAPPISTDDRDVGALMFLIAVVILVIANTLIISLWFLRPILTRDRRLTPCSKRVV